MNDLESINEKTRRAYNTAAEKYHELYHNEMNEKAYDRALLDSFAAGLDADAAILDAGCGPSGHIGRYLFDKGFAVVGVDISDRCVELAGRHNPGMTFHRGDIGDLPFPDGSFDGVISFYSIIDTPRKYVGSVFSEFFRVLRPGGSLIVAVKAGTDEGFIDGFWDLHLEIYMTLFTKEEIADYYERAGFLLEFLEQRHPYDFELQNDRIFAIGGKP
jgi:SAM-dependent methyltransferase